MDILEYIKENYKEDGFIYCIKTGFNENGKSIVKCGRVEMKKEENEFDVVEKVLRRYNTYYMDCEIIYWKRVGNNREAEKKLFRKLEKLHYEKEKFYYDKQIEDIFNEIEKEYPSIENIIGELSIEKQTKLNGFIRINEKRNTN